MRVRCPCEKDVTLDRFRQHHRSIRCHSPYARWRLAYRRVGALAHGLHRVVVRSHGVGSRAKSVPRMLHKISPNQFRGRPKCGVLHLNWTLELSQGLWNSGTEGAVEALRALQVAWMQAANASRSGQLRPRRRSPPISLVYFCGSFRPIQASSALKSTADGLTILTRISAKQTV